MVKQAFGSGVRRAAVEIHAGELILRFTPFLSKALARSYSRERPLTGTGMPSLDALGEC